MRMSHLYNDYTTCLYYGGIMFKVVNTTNREDSLGIALRWDLGFTKWPTNNLECVKV